MPPLTSLAPPPLPWPLPWPRAHARPDRASRVGIRLSNTALEASSTINATANALGHCRMSDALLGHCQADDALADDATLALPWARCAVRRRAMFRSRRGRRQFQDSARTRVGGAGEINISIAVRVRNGGFEKETRTWLITVVLFRLFRSQSSDDFLLTERNTRGDVSSQVDQLFICKRLYRFLDL